MGSAKSFSDMWETGDIDAESAKSFSRSMFNDSRLPAKIHCASRPFGQVSSLIDLGGGGGGGAWAAEALRTHENLNDVIFDLANVCEATKVILTDEAPDFVQPSFRTGNFFRDELPTADGYLLSNILHDWDFDICRQLLRHIHRFAAPNSKLFLNECLLTEDKSGPRFTALFN